MTFFATRCPLKRQRLQAHQLIAEHTNFSQKRLATGGAPFQLVAALLQATELGAQFALRFTELLAQLGLLVQQTVVFVGQRVEAFEFRLHGGQLSQPASDDPRTGHQSLGGANLPAQLRKLVFAGGLLIAEPFKLAQQTLALVGLGLQVAQASVGVGLGLLGLRNHGTASGGLFAGLLHAGRPETQLAGTLFEVFDQASQARQLISKALRPLFRLRREAFVLAQIEHIGQHLLALTRRAGGELIGATLEQKRGVDEGLVRHPQQIVNRALGFAHADLACRTPTKLIPQLEVELAFPGGRAAPFTRATALTTANNAVRLLAKLKLEINTHLALTLRDQVIVSHPRLAPKRPGKCIEQG